MTSSHRHPSKQALSSQGLPRWVIELGTTPAADAILEALKDGALLVFDLADRLNYAPVTIRCTCLALSRLGQIERTGTTVRRINQ
jgi:hypothetical protein